MSAAPVVALKKLKVLDKDIKAMAVVTSRGLNTQPTRVYRKCPHGRRRNRCKDCGGSSICEHKRRRNECKDCGGASVCEHGRQRHLCKDCGGSSICEHERVRSECKDCGGASICVHKRRRNKCKECGGASICEHKRIRNLCKDCGGASICEHNRQRNVCKDCGGASICEHNRRRNVCKDCGGASICEHNRRRNVCKDCGGASICEHKRGRSQCVDCNGSKTCRGHAKIKCGHLGNPKYDMYCTHCFPQFFKDDTRVRLIRTKSHETTYVNMIMTEMPIELVWTWDKPIYVDFDGGCCATKRRIDIRALIEHPDKGLFWLCVEIDERQHKSYAAGYEEARYNDLFMDFPGNYVFLRINPDSFVQAGKRLNPSFEDRKQTIVDKIVELVKSGPQSNEQLVDVYHLFYDQ